MKKSNKSATISQPILFNQATYSADQDEVKMSENQIYQGQVSNKNRESQDKNNFQQQLVNRKQSNEQLLTANTPTKSAYLSQPFGKDQYSTSSYRSLLISSRDTIMRKKNSQNKPGTAAGSMNLQKNNGFITDRFTMSQTNGFLFNQNKSRASRDVSSQNGVKKNYQLKDGYLSTNQVVSQANQNINKSKSNTLSQNDFCQMFQKQNYDGMALEDYFNQRENFQTEAIQIASPNQPKQLSSQQNRKQKNMQNLSNSQAAVFSQINNNYQQLNQSPEIATAIFQKNQQSNAFTNQIMGSSMYQSTLIQQQINELCQNYQHVDLTTLKNILVNLIQREEEMLRVLTSRCSGVKELAEMIYADIPLPMQQNQNHVMSNPKSIDQQQSPNNCVNSSYYDNTTPIANNNQQILNQNNNLNILTGQPVNDLAKIRDALFSLSQSLVSASQNEINLGSKNREIERMNLEISQLKKSISDYKEKNINLQKLIELLQNRVKTFQEDNNRMLIQMNIEKKSAQVNSKKVTNLEKRVEFILENDINTNLNPNDKLRQTLNELLRENEALKRDLNHKNQDIDRLQGQLKKLNSHLARANKKMENMKQNPAFNSQTTPVQNPPSQQTENKLSSMFQKDDIELLKNFKIPQNLNFRVVSLRSDQSILMSDIIELGSHAFSRQILGLENPEQKKQMVNFITSQLTSYKDLSDKLNQIINHAYNMSTLETFEDLSVHVSTHFPSIFSAQRANLWVVDKQCGIFQSFSEQGSGNIVTSKCLLNKGLINDTFLLRVPINSKNSQNKPLLYKIDYQREECEFVNSTLLIPVFCNKERQQVKAILEISNSQSEIFSFDEEYYGIILSYFLTSIFSSIINQKIFDIDCRYNTLLFNSYEQLSQQKTRFNFTQKVKMLVQQLFNIDNSHFYFVENDHLISYNKPNQQKDQFSLEHGLAGIVAKEKKSYIIHDIRSSSYFNPLVDISSLLPIYAIPLINKTNSDGSDEQKEPVIGVIEIVLKSKLKSKLEKEAIIDSEDGYFGLDEPQTHIIQKFSKLVINTLLNNQFID
ncbi:hypothetical protein TTHERM_00264890 (macronuclear) [Tetrahymena thermophila SB210]|uniref:GAF domain protein n=1 Tax=Tetrahymena thermophila (strain SB210) TaxID=312017 RepID=Q22TZ3_TETTS|nr:hypothetical protein TTHERM_00264890 [Tetrahymena thermophila SB210]EAR88894.2 hypothetical protein TTHERM_00264890 [Tetrahymena thermophila SB210]|eukprot:XP_001009139.2 hypothetical protein TTHERM_00264890 [Tetrahymena thermophila SB210]